MSFSIIIEDQNGDEVERCWQRGNERYLLVPETEYSLLGDLNLVSYDVFSSEQARDLGMELRLLHKQLVEGLDRAFVARLAELADLVSERNGWSMTFTPFSKAE